MKIEITEQIRIKIETSWIGRTPTPSNFSSSAHCHLEHMLVRDDGRSRYMGDRRAMIEGHLIKLIFLLQLQSNFVIRNVLKLVLRNHFPLPIDNLLHKYKEHLALRNNFRATKKFLITKFDCSTKMGGGINRPPVPLSPYPPQAPPAPNPDARYYRRFQSWFLTRSSFFINLGRTL